MYAAEDSSADWITGGSFQILPWRQSASDVLWFCRCKIDRTSCAARYTDEGQSDCQTNGAVGIPSMQYRPNRSLYVSGCGGSKVLSPATMRSNTNCPKPGQTNKPDSSRVSAALASIGKTNILLNANCKPDIEQACIRPVSPDAAPVVGRIPGADNAFSATGGGPWGITWGPVVGQSIARLLLDGDPPINLRNFSPRRQEGSIHPFIAHCSDREGSRPAASQ